MALWVLVWCQVALDTLIDDLIAIVHTSMRAQACVHQRIVLARTTFDTKLRTPNRDLKEEGLALLGVIQGASAGAPWEVLLDMTGASDFSAAYP